MKTLKLFNAVVAKPATKKGASPYVSEDGYVIEPKALWAQDRIVAFYKKEALNGRDLNKTFHKSWAKIKHSTRGELAVEQILHYLSTYGTNFTGEIYIPEEVLRVPDIKVVFKVVKAYSAEQLTEKCLNMLRSGVALQESTITDLLEVLTDELKYTFTGKEGIRNKEAIVKIADLYGVVPADFSNFFRYIIYRATNSAVVVKNKRTVGLIKVSSFNPGAQFNIFGLERLAENFNRFKPLFLAFKSKCPKTINKIAKLSKKLHKPMVQNPLNLVTQRELTKADVHWLDNATPYAIFKALSAIHLRMNGQSVFMYKIRNGKSYVKEGTGNFFRANYNFLLKYLKGRFDLSDKKIYIPKDIVYALPTSEKMYVGNIPMGTKFYGDKLAVGIYWENSWGARDLDLSGLSAEGKTGWNAAYGRGGSGDGLMFSGDITDAPNGAVEYLYAQKGIPGPTLVLNNVFNGNPDSEFKIIVGKGADITKRFMMDPNNLFMEAKVKAVQTQSIIGILLPEGKQQSFALLNFGAGNTHVSGYNDTSTLARVALVQEWRNPLSFNAIVEALGAEIVDSLPSKKKSDVIDLSLNSLEKDSFLRIFDKTTDAVLV